jgi:hypothetical protein
VQEDGPGQFVRTYEVDEPARIKEPVREREHQVGIEPVAPGQDRHSYGRRRGFDSLRRMQPGRPDKILQEVVHHSANGFEHGLRTDPFSQLGIQVHNLAHAGERSREVTSGRSLARRADESVDGGRFNA